jgi:uncharacterized protein YaiE (UPF0345 family)
MSIPTQFNNVTVIAKANIYFDGKVISHTIFLNDSSKKTLGLIYPGKYKFDTGVAEIMEVVAGKCSIKLKGENNWVDYERGTFFKVPGNSFFEISVKEGVMEYICSYE